MRSARSAALLAQTIHIPDVAIFLLAGIALGPHGLQPIDIQPASALNQIILLFGASYIRGAAVRLDVLKRVWITVAVLAAAGVLITAAITGLAAHAVFGTPALRALLLGSAALLIAHERWAVLAEYAPVVTRVAVICAYFAASGLQTSGFIAVFVFGVVPGRLRSEAEHAAPI